MTLIIPNRNFLSINQWLYVKLALILTPAYIYMYVYLHIYKKKHLLLLHTQAALLHVAR